MLASVLDSTLDRPLSLSPDLNVLTAVEVFSAPRAAIDAIDVAAIVRQADEDDVARSRIELTAVDPDAESIQVSCCGEMGIRLLCAWVEAAKHAAAESEDGVLLAALRSAAEAARTACDDARRSREMGCF